MKTICALLLGLLALAPEQGHAQSWPSRPIQIIVSSGAGGAADIMARLVGEQLSTALGQPVVVENRPGEIGRAHV